MLGTVERNFETRKRVANNRDKDAGSVTGTRATENTEISEVSFVYGAVEGSRHNGKFDFLMPPSHWPKLFASSSQSDCEQLANRT